MLGVGREGLGFSFWPQPQTPLPRGDRRLHAGAVQMLVISLTGRCFSAARGLDVAVFSIRVWPVRFAPDGLLNSAFLGFFGGVKGSPATEIAGFSGIEGFQWCSVLL